ncbi:MAG: reprolysin-like metallopeptidase [Gammaproteobacteria bacterium]
MNSMRIFALLTAALATAPALAIPIFESPGRINAAALALPEGEYAHLTLPDGTTFDVQVLPRKQHASGNVTWRGRITGADRNGYVVLLTGGEHTGVFGTLITPQGEFRLSPGTGAWNDITWTKATPVAPLRPDVFPTAPKRVGPSTGVRKDHAATTELNVLVQYTENVRAGMSSAQWATYLDNLLATTNEAFVQSGTMIQLTLAGHQLTPISTSADSELALDFLQFASGTEDWRYALDAHFVTLLRAYQTSHASCGAARLPVCGDDAQCYDESFGYSAVSLGPECSDLMLAHQIAHNLGAAHEPGEGQTGTYAYAHAHLLDDNEGTVMAWSGADTLVARFSDPALDCGGEPCGVDGVSDNVRTLEQTRHYIDRWLTDQSIEFVDSPTEFTRDSSAEIEFDWFGVLGTRFDIGLYRNGTLVAEFATDESIPTGVKTVHIPASLDAGPGYQLRVSSANLPTVFVETPVSLGNLAPASIFSFASPMVTASGSSATLTVQRTGVTNVAAEVDYATMGGSAHSGTNYTPVNGTLSWAAGDTTPRTITITNIRAAESGNAVSILVVLDNPSNGARLGTPAIGEVVIPGKAGGGSGGGGAFGAGALVALLSLLLLAARRPRRPLSVRCTGR